MIDPQSLETLAQELRRCMESDRCVLEELRADVRPLRDATRRIQPRPATAVSLVATDGGNNRIQFDPFLVQLVRVVDSNNNELFLEAVTPTSDVRALSRRQLDDPGGGTALGRLMRYLVSALDARQALVTLDLHAESEAGAVEAARNRGLTVISLRAQAQAPARAWGGSSAFPTTLFSVELVSLLEAGLNLVEALQTLTDKETPGERHDQERRDHDNHFRRGQAQ